MDFAHLAKEHLNLGDGEIFKEHCGPSEPTTCTFGWFQWQSDYGHIIEGNLISAHSKTSRASRRVIIILLRKAIWNISMSVISVLTQLHSSAPPKVGATIYHRSSSTWHLLNHLLPRGSISAGSCDFKDGDPPCLGVWFLEMSPDQSDDSAQEVARAFHQNHHFGLWVTFKDSFSK